MAETPSSLELSLIEGMENVKGDPRLIALAQQAREEHKEGDKYIFRD